MSSVKTVYLRPIGTLQTLGTRREWLVDAAGVACLCLICIALLILL